MCYQQCDETMHDHCSHVVGIFIKGRFCIVSSSSTVVCGVFSVLDMYVKSEGT